MREEKGSPRETTARDAAHKLCKAIVPACVVGDDAAEHSRLCDEVTSLLLGRELVMRTKLADLRQRLRVANEALENLGPMIRSIAREGNPNSVENLRGTIDLICRAVEGAALTTTEKPAGEGR